MKLGLTEMKICLTSVDRNENMSLETSNDHIQVKEQFEKRHKIKIEKEKHEKKKRKVAAFSANLSERKLYAKTHTDMITLKDAYIHYSTTFRKKHHH